jgi:endonuclease/exonuclease/phosphatase family metal-dependent hydrolase
VVLVAFRRYDSSNLLVCTLVVVALFGPATGSWGEARAGTVRRITDPAAYVCSERGFIDFENFDDETNLSAETFEGLQFTTSGGHTWRVGDFATGGYSDDLYASKGTHWAWLGEVQSAGRIDFIDGPAGVFSLLVSSNSPIWLEAYDSQGDLLETAGPSPRNIETGDMDELRIERPQRDMSYVVVHDSGNHFLVDAICTDAPGAPRQLRVLTWNVQGDPDNRDGSIRPKRLPIHEFGVEIRYRAADVVALQEVEDPAQAKAIDAELESLTDRRWHRAWAGDGNVVLSRYRVIDLPDLVRDDDKNGDPLPRRCDKPYPECREAGRMGYEFDRDHDRTVQRVVVRVAGTSINVYNTHLCPRGAGDVRQRCAGYGGWIQAGIALSYVRFDALNRAEDQPFYPILTGDLNARPMDEGMNPIERLERHFLDAWSAHAGHLAGYDRRCREGIDEPGFEERDRICGWTTNSLDPQGRIDYVMVGRDSGISLGDATAPSAEEPADFWLGDNRFRRISDHLPVVATVILPR